jgi:hypothetical protein
MTAVAEGGDKSVAYGAQALHFRLFSAPRFVLKPQAHRRQMRFQRMRGQFVS